MPALPRPGLPQMAVPLMLLAAASAARAQDLDAARDLMGRLNDYRSSKGLQPVLVSPLLTRVAEAHVRDLERNPPEGACNGHSWSPSRQWKACCYTDDHAKAQCMWDKPIEITQGAYPGQGFEIWAWRSGTMTVDFALEGWKSSPAHHAVVLSQGHWAQMPWRAMGAAISQHYAVVWFGALPDRSTTP